MAPATIGTRPAATSMAISMTRSHSSWDRVGVFAGGATWDEEIDAGFDLPLDERAEGAFVNAAVCFERRYQGCTTAAKLKHKGHLKLALYAKGSGGENG